MKVLAVEATPLDGVKVIKPGRIGDARGYFCETFNQRAFCEHVADTTFVQDNQSLNVKAGTVRGLHFQAGAYVQGKLVQCASGSVFDVAVDMRVGSPTFGKWFGCVLSAENGFQLWVPAGFAHGFCTLEANTLVQYKVTAHYSPDHEGGFIWDDPKVGIEWPDCADRQTLSPRDRHLPDFDAASKLLAEAERV